MSYLVANITRWTTHFIAFDRLLVVERALRHAVFSQRPAIVAAQVGAEKNKKKADKLSDSASAQCNVIEDSTFWKNLRTVVSDIEPICLATNINQKDCVRPDQVLLAFAGMYTHFTSHAVNVVRTGMVKQIEKRWKAMDQPLFVFSLILNPYEKLECFGDNAGISPFSLNNALVEVCTNSLISNHLKKLTNTRQLYRRITSRPNQDDDHPNSTAEKVKVVSRAFMEYLSNKGPFAEFADSQEQWEEISVSVKQ